MNASVFASLPSSACVLSSQGAAGPDRITRYGYTNADQVSTVTSGYASPAPIVEAATTYTNNGLPASVTDGAGNVTTFVYDGFDRLSRQRYPLAAGGGSSTSDYEEYTYNAASAVTIVRRRDLQQINFVYDNLLRVASLDAPGTDDDVAYSYDLFSRTLSAAKGGQTLLFVYDALSRLTLNGYRP